MYVFLYNLGIRFYHFGIIVSSLFNKKAKAWRRGRKNWKEEISKIAEHHTNCYWFHCSSLGEFEQARPVIEELSRQKGKENVLLSFFSPSGYTIRKDFDQVARVFYLPLDTKENANFIVDRLKPKMVLFCKYDLWYQLINKLQSTGIPHFLFSATFRKEQIFFKGYGKLFRKMLNSFDHIMVQDEASIPLLNSIGVKSCSKTGDTRFDRVLKLPEEDGLQDIDRFSQGHKVIVVGSSWPEDERKLIQAFQSEDLKGIDFKVIIAPHEINKSQMAQLKRALGKGSKLYSEGFSADDRFLIIDSIGILGRLYRYGDLAWIGGGFGKGIHNVLEPAAYGCCIGFGPNYNRFIEAKHMINNELADSFSSAAGIAAWMKKHFNHPEITKSQSERVKTYLSENSGAGQKTIDKIFSQ